LHLHAAQAELQHAPVGADGVRAIDGQIHDYLVELRGVGHDGRKALRKNSAEFNVRGCRGAKQFEGFFNQERKLHGFSGEFLRPAEDQNAPHQVGGARRGLTNFHQALLSGMARGQVAGGQLEVAADGQQDIVEFMRDAARQCAQTFQFLRADAHLFRMFAVGDVRDRAHHMGGSAGLILVVRAAGPNPSNRPILADDPALEVPLGLLLPAFLK
jgi:hypothetical protein